MNLAEKVQSLIAASNSVTGESDATLTDAVQTLCAGYGQGGTEPGYVTDGLVCRFDAIRNTRAGHDAAAETWEDLSGNGYDLTSEGTNPPIWGNNWCYLSNAWLDGAPIVGDTPHVEIVMQLGRNYLQFLAGSGSGADSKIGSAIAVTSLKFIGAKRGGFDYSHEFPTDPRVYSAWFEETQSDLYYTKTGLKRSAFDFTSPTRLAVGGRSVSESYSTNSYILALRFYNRILTAEEIAQNFTADAVRFGAGTKVITLEELFSALPTVTTAHTISVNADQKAAASVETIAIATGKGWTVA